MPVTLVFKSTVSQNRESKKAKNIKKKLGSKQAWFTSSKGDLQTF